MSDVELRELQEAAGVIKTTVHLVSGNTEAEIDSAFATVFQQGVNHVFVGGHDFFSSHSVQLQALAAR